MAGSMAEVNIFLVYPSTKACVSVVMLVFSCLLCSVMCCYVCCLVPFNLEQLFVQAATDNIHNTCDTYWLRIKLRLWDAFVTSLLYVCDVIAICL